MVQLQWQLQCLWESVVLGFVIFLFLFFWRRVCDGHIGMGRLSFLCLITVIFSRDV